MELYLVTITFAEWSLRYKVRAENEQEAIGRVNYLHKGDKNPALSTTAVPYTGQRFDHDIDAPGYDPEGSDYEDEVDFEAD